MSKNLYKSILKGIAWLSLFAWMALIFCLSAQTGDKSHTLSTPISNNIVNNNYTPAEREEFTEEMKKDYAMAVEGDVRFVAHVCEYAILSFLFFFAVFSITKSKKKSAFYSIIGSVIYAISDEIHQYFVKGRACDIIDVLTDSIGVINGVAGAIIVLVIVLFGVSLFKRKTKKIQN